jgi:hypothetical protein
MRRAAAQRLILGGLLAALLVPLLAVGNASAISFSEAGVSVRETAANGVLHQAGAHPDFTTRFAISETAEDPWESPRDIVFKLPPGLIADPSAMPECPISKLYTVGTVWGLCPSESQVGTIRLRLALQQNEAGSTFTRAIYNLTPPSDAPALFGFVVEGVVVFIVPKVDPRDYSISAGSYVSGQGLELKEARVTFWGVPADPIHDPERSHGASEGTPEPTTAPLRPFMINPTSCSDASAVFTAEIASWLNPGVFDTATIDKDEAGNPINFEGCSNVPFRPVMHANPSSREASAPAGLDINIEVPQSNSPYGVASSSLRAVKLTFPKGMSLSASAATGLGACSLAQIGLGSNNPPSCPDSSKIGDTTLRTPLLAGEFGGKLYLAKQDENPFGSRFAMYLVIQGPGFYIKLPGKIEIDPVTGQVSTTFDNAPQFPFSELHMIVKSGARAPLVLPSICGTYTTTATLTPWSGTAPVTTDSNFTLDQGCAKSSQFSPSLKAGPTDPTAGGYSPFVFRVDRPEGQQNLSRIQATLPEGMLAKLAGVPLCAEAQAPTGACPLASRVGSATVAAGEGANPLYVPEPGKAPTAVYLAGPYKSAPYSLVVKVPAEAGPFDLGTVAVRNGLSVDPTTTQATVSSDPLPQILEGIPITYRTVHVDIDRRDFTVNPTSCAPKRVDSQLTSAQGMTASPSARLQVTNCAALGFSPRLSLKTIGGTERGSYPKLRAVLNARKGEANIGRVAVTLPHSEFLAQQHIKTICTRVQFAAEACPKGSIYGYATATTPLLDQPLGGPVYLRSSSHPLPDLVAALRGPLDVNLVGRIDSVNGGIRTTFDAVPDAPVSKFVLSMLGGKKGLLVNSRNLCAGANRAKVLIDGQNGKAADQGPAVGNSCSFKAKRAQAERR